MPPTVRTLDQILGELGTVYQPQIQSMQTRMGLIPGQIAEEEKGLQAKQETAFGDILSGARRRGTGVAFGGIPLSEQATYTANEFLPSLARLKQSGREQAMTLQDAINQVNERKQTQAMGVRQYEQSRLDAYDSEQRQLAAQRAAAAAQTSDLSKYFDQMNADSAASTPVMSYDKTKGYQFSIGGKPVTAATFASQRGIPFRQLLSDMARNGDKNAKIALKYVGNDGMFGSAPQQYAGSMQALGAIGNFAKPKPKPVQQPTLVQRYGQGYGQVVQS